MSQEHQPEDILSALAVILGPDTDYTQRVRATKRLARYGPAAIPQIITTLNNYPEIPLTAWPFSPPQYEQVGHLLQHLSKQATIPATAFLEAPLLEEAPGPVLWASVLEAIGLELHAEAEPLLQQGLQAPWQMVRYAATLVLAGLSKETTLQSSTQEQLRSLIQETEALPIRLCAAYTLLCSHNSEGLKTLEKLLCLPTPAEGRRATAFLLATDPPIHLNTEDREHLCDYLIQALQDPLGEIARNAAYVLGTIASTSTLFSLRALFIDPRNQVKIAALLALEEAARRETVRPLLQHQALPMLLIPLLRGSSAEVRHQASATLAAFGGEYAIAVLGTLLLNKDQPGYLEALEALIVLHGVLKPPTRSHVVRWLLQALHTPRTDIQFIALDAFGNLLWQARMQNQQAAYDVLSQQLEQDGTLLQLLGHSLSPLRKRALALLNMLQPMPKEMNAALLRQLQQETEHEIRVMLIERLGLNGAHESIPALIQCLLDPGVAAVALISLYQLSDGQNYLIYSVLRELAFYQVPQQRADRRTRIAQKLLKKWRMFNEPE